MFTSDITPAATADAVGRVPRPDTECQARAHEFLVGVIGSASRRPDLGSTRIGCRATPTSAGASSS